MSRDILLQIAQVLTVMLLAPLLQGVILQWQERVQRARGPGVLQPYRELSIPQWVANCYFGMNAKRTPSTDAVRLGPIRGDHWPASMSGRSMSARRPRRS